MNELERWQKELAEVDKAISKITGGAQSYGMTGQHATRADLATLYSRKKELEGKIEMAIYGSQVVVSWAQP